MGNLIVEYRLRNRQWFLFQAAGALLLSILAFFLYRLFIGAGFTHAEFLLYPAIAAALSVITFTALFLGRKPQISVYENGIAIDGSLILWSEIQKARYRRYKKSDHRIEYEWRLDTASSNYKFSMNERHKYIDRTQLNAIFVDKVADFRDESRVI